jgi:hypothetical protein
MMDKDTQLKLFNELNAHTEKWDDRGVLIPTSLFMDLLNALGTDHDRDDAPQQQGELSPDAYALLIHARAAAGSANDHRERMWQAWHSLGTLKHVAEADRFAKSGLVILESILRHFDHKTCQLMDAVELFEEYDNAR